jgi:hypothetical protein
MSVEQKSNITAQLESKIISQVIIAIQREYAAECNAEISKIMADYQAFVKTYPAELYVNEPYDENDGSVIAWRFHDTALAMVAELYGIEGISCTVWINPNWRDGDPTMYLYKFGPKIGYVGALSPQFAIVG